MTDLVLWRAITETDFRAMNGQAAPSGTGGGAMHIALGTAKVLPTIRSFLNTKEDLQAIDTEPTPPSVGPATLTFHSNPKRRGGEWRITDQYNHRHPAWTVANGFPNTYDRTNRPVIFVIRHGNKYFATCSRESEIRKQAASLAVAIGGRANAGIIQYDPTWATFLKIGPTSSPLTDQLKAIAKISAETGANAFNPTDIADGRTRILAEVVRRQGQQGFRRRLLAAYKVCAITGSHVEATLEAAHITPYRGKDTNHVTNGLLLRADLHTLFDLGLITVGANDYRVRVSPVLNGTEYQAYSGKRIILPASNDKHPSRAALTEHMKSFQAGGS